MDPQDAMQESEAQISVVVHGTLGQAEFIQSMEIQLLGNEQQSGILFESVIRGLEDQNFKLEAEQNISIFMCYLFYSKYLEKT